MPMNIPEKEGRNFQEVHGKGLREKREEINVAIRF